MFILFTYRGSDGELRLGVRRAVQLKNEALLEAVNSTDSKLRTLLWPVPWITEVYFTFLSTQGLFTGAQYVHQIIINHY